MFERLAREQPFRILARALLKLRWSKLSLQTRIVWELSKRPPYLLALAEAAGQAKRQGVTEISAIEFGVAGGNGLVVLEEEAEAVTKATGVKIRVFGFDSGPGGLPPSCGDHRDHPDIWQPGDFEMDVPALKRRLSASTTLILGNVRDTVDEFFTKHKAPTVGFVAFDLDLYSSTKDALRIFTAPGAKMLWHVPCVVDDIEFMFHNKWAGEFLAIEEFNREQKGAKGIDRWNGVRNGMAFPERSYFDKMFIAHDLDAVSELGTRRVPNNVRKLALDQ